MQVKVLIDTFISGAFPTPVKGEIRDVDEALGMHLIDAGVVEAVKIEAPVVKKSEPSSVSLQGQASQEKTATKRRGRPRKQSQSTTATD